jgi:hypothetical protein
MKVAKILMNGGNQIPANNTNFGDPFPGIVKYLIVIYQAANGMVKHTSVKEGGIAYLM